MTSPSTARAHSDEARDDAKRRAARVYDRAIRLSGYSNAQVAELTGVSETRVRRERSDDPADLDVVPSLADAILADHTLGEYVMQEIRAERLALHGAAPAVTPEQKLHKAMGAAAQFAAVGAAALEDGVLEPHEVPDVERARVAMQQQGDDLAALFRSRKDLIR